MIFIRDTRCVNNAGFYMTRWDIHWNATINGWNDKLAKYIIQSANNYSNKYTVTNMKITNQDLIKSLIDTQYGIKSSPQQVMSLSCCCKTILSLRHMH